MTITLDPCPACERRHTLDPGLAPGTIRCPNCLQDVDDLLDQDQHLDGCAVPGKLKKKRWSTPTP
jgi:hypothetical protein